VLNRTFEEEIKSTPSRSKKDEAPRANQQKGDLVKARSNAEAFTLVDSSKSEFVEHAKLHSPTEVNFIEQEHGQQESVMFELSGCVEAYMSSCQFCAKEVDEHQEEKDIVGQLLVNNEHQRQEAIVVQCFVVGENQDDKARDQEEARALESYLEAEQSIVPFVQPLHP
jgi:uncharacterized Fe-S cluster-containing MiaB family protein